MNKKSRCVVTGCAGFVGSHLTLRLLEQGCEVIGVDNLSSGCRHNMNSFAGHPSFFFHETQIEEPDLLHKLQKHHAGIKSVFHLAAVVSAPYSVEHPEKTMEINHATTLRLHEEAENMGMSAFVFAGSAAEYGNVAELPVKEEDATPTTVHTSPYGRSKYLSSTFIEASGFGCSLRFFNIYGPRQDPSSQYSGVISRFVDSGLAGHPLTIFGDGSQSRDFIYVSDAADAYISAAGIHPDNATPLTGVYNVCSGHSISILQLAETVKKMTNNNMDISFGPVRPGDIAHSLGDNSRFNKKVRFHPTAELDEGLRKTIAWFKKQRSLQFGITGSARHST